jgi:hypothetical protein
LPEATAKHYKSGPCTFYVPWPSCFLLTPFSPSDPHRFFRIRTDAG